jgi:hypothetical protein
VVFLLLVEASQLEGSAGTAAGGTVTKHDGKVQGTLKRRKTYMQIVFGDG